ncbi:Gfo/Idh/MocA family protein [Lignipirellula cremea]|uniref:Inositol 2-dehydrogenase n=1 Tax=Lignipirellula cremea TaxID=2528010 RepID=A0A518DRF5_9BACT|nr:Gfo/Idh/MocA family oxidoreductase [Lignipirellula cremea]QDU94428.1 Inositol 2-dehydrogenase [Lignipirellula cremea]
MPNKKDATSTPASSTTSRRSFMKTTGSSLLIAGGAVAATGLSVARAAHSFGDGKIKIGLIGCGGRGTGAARQAMNTSGGDVVLTAMADAFGDRLQGAYRGLKSAHGDLVQVTKDQQFVGFDAYKDVLASDVDLVILATPPGFRPLHVESAIAAGKHVFMEKPVAVDAPGVRRVLAAGEEAKKKGLAIACGLQRRHERAYMETMDQLHGGAIGDIVFARGYWNGAGVWVRPRTDQQTELEYQMRNWYYFNWLCGDHINEQHIHNLDVINWLMEGYPVKAQGVGGREVRTGLDNGQIYDHHMVEYTYSNGRKSLSQCRHIPGCWNSVTEFAHGTTGTCDISGGKIFNAAGEQTWATEGSRGGHQQEHHDLFAELRKGNTPNEAEYGALSTMTAIMGRMATYSGKEINWEDALNSQISLATVDALHNLNDVAPVQPDAEGRYPIAVPGETKTV